MIVRARAPLRLGLAGGGTDVSPYCDLHGGSVMNVTIDKYAYATIDASPDGLAHFIAQDAGACERIAPAEAIADAGPLQLAKGVYRRIVADHLDGRAPAIRVSTVPIRPTVRPAAIRADSARYEVVVFPEVPVIPISLSRRDGCP